MFLVKITSVAFTYIIDFLCERWGVRYLYKEVGDWYIGGSLEGIQLPIHYDFSELRLTPADSHRALLENGWRNVIGFQTEKHLHCAHREMIFNAAREARASIFLLRLI